jgi:exonuclease III
MRLISWNIRGGRHSDVVAAIQRLRPDVAVLVDCKEKRVETIVTKAAEAGFTHHLSSCTDYTGILMLSTHPLFQGDIVQVGMPHRWLHAVSDHWDLEIAAMYGPLPKAIRQEPTMKEFWNWLVPASDRLVLRRAVLCGDFNTGISGQDGPDDYRFSIANQFKNLEAQGWRDAYRELHPEGLQRSWWRNGRGFRIDHCMLSRGLQAPTRVDYTTETGGLVLGSSASDQSAAISDHAAMVLDF